MSHSHPIVTARLIKGLVDVPPWQRRYIPLDVIRLIGDTVQKFVIVPMNDYRLVHDNPLCSGYFFDASMLRDITPSPSTVLPPSPRIPFDEGNGATSTDAPTPAVGTDLPTPGKDVPDTSHPTTDNRQD